MLLAQEAEPKEPEANTAGLDDLRALRQRLAIETVADIGGDDRKLRLADALLQVGRPAVEIAVARGHEREADLVHQGDAGGPERCHGHEVAARELVPRVHEDDILAANLGADQSADNVTFADCGLPLAVTAEGVYVVKGILTKRYVRLVLDVDGTSPSIKYSASLNVNV